MRADNRTANITDEQSAQYLLQVLHSQHINQVSKERAAIRVARMRLENRTTVITDNQAAQYFQQALNSQNLPQRSKPLSRKIKLTSAHSRQGDPRSQGKSRLGDPDTPAKEIGIQSPRCFWAPD